MNNTQTCEKLRAMRLQAMAELHEQHLASNQHTSMTTDEYLGQLTDHQWEARQHQKTRRLLKQAHFKQRTTLEEINGYSGDADPRTGHTDPSLRS